MALEQFLQAGTAALRELETAGAGRAGTGRSNRQIRSGGAPLQVSAWAEVSEDCPIGCRIANPHTVEIAFGDWDGSCELRLGRATLRRFTNLLSNTLREPLPTNLGKVKVEVLSDLTTQHRTTCQHPTTTDPTTPGDPQRLGPESTS